jgi:hypothetical protein
MIHGELVTIVFGVRLRMREVIGPKKGKSRRYQVTTADPVRDPWHKSAGDAANYRGPGLPKEPRLAPHAEVRAQRAYLASKRNTLAPSLAPIT